MTFALTIVLFMIMVLEIQTIFAKKRLRYSIKWIKKIKRVISEIEFLATLKGSIDICLLF